MLHQHLEGDVQVLATRAALNPLSDDHLHLLDECIQVVFGSLGKVADEPQIGQNRRVAVGVVVTVNSGVNSIQQLERLLELSWLEKRRAQVDFEKGKHDR